MFSKIFLRVLLLTSVYTYILKSIKDNSDTNYQQLPNNLKFELNRIQTVKPNLKYINPNIFKLYMGAFFGKAFEKNIVKYKIAVNDQYQLFLTDKNIISKFKKCEKPDDIKNIFSNDILPFFEKELAVEDQNEIEKDLKTTQYEFLKDLEYMRTMLGSFTKYIEENI